MRRVKRKINKSPFAPELVKWHCTLREGFIKSCANETDSPQVKGNCRSDTGTDFH